MRKLECMLILLLLCSVGMNAQKTVKPKVSFVTDKAVKVQSVEVTDTETILDITSEGDWWSLDSGTKLIFPNAENKVCSLTVKRVESGDRFCKFNTQYEVPNRAIRLKIHFPRLPAGVDNINLSEPGGWGITGISIKTTTSAPFATQKNEETVSAQGNASSAQRGNATASTQTQGGFAMAAAKGTKTPARTQAASLLPKPQGHDYVDLGLPSKTLWATMNIGATKPEQVGAYFAWGETKPKQNYAKAIPLLTEAAEHGDTNAQWMLAQLYLEGKHTTRDISKAWNYATASSKEGNPIGAFWLSVLYEHGEGMTMGAVERTQRADALFEEAKAALERMAKQGKASTNQDGNALKVEQFIQKADMFETLGRMLEQEGKESDALDWYGKAADEGSRYAQKQMGDWLMTGSIDGILRLTDKTADNKALKPQQDRMKATDYYRKAANQGDVDAQNMLGILLVQQYRNQSTNFGRAMSKDLLTEARQNFQNAADQRNIDALYNLGYCYENGYGCAKDKNKAVLYYQMAAGSGHKKAEEHLMEMR